MEEQRFNQAAQFVIVKNPDLLKSKKLVGC